MRIKKNETVPVVTIDKQVAIKNDQPKTPTLSKIKNITTEKPRGNVLPKKPVLVIKSGDTDMRRGIKTLNKLIERTGHNPHDGNMYAFSNNRDTIKIIQQKEDGMEMLVKKMMELIYFWPEYEPPGKSGYMLVLNGFKRIKFLEAMGYFKA